MAKNLDLNVNSPFKVASILLATANAYDESSVELDSAWQDPNAGRPWRKIADILERAARQIDREIGA